MAFLGIYWWNRYGLTFTDDATRYATVVMIPNKNSSTIRDAFIDFCAHVKTSTDNTIKVIRTDGGGVYGKFMAVYLKQMGFSIKPLPPVLHNLMESPRG